MSNSHEHPKVFRRASESIRDMVENLPILSREMVTCKMSKQDLYETMERRMSFTSSSSSSFTSIKTHHHQQQQQQQSFESNNNIQQQRQSNTNTNSGGDTNPRRERRSSSGIRSISSRMMMMDNSSRQFVMNSIQRHSSSSLSPTTTDTSTEPAAAAAAAAEGSDDMIHYSNNNKNSTTSTTNISTRTSSVNKSIPEDASIEEGLVIKPFQQLAAPDDVTMMIGGGVGGSGGCCGCGVWKSFDLDPSAKGYAILGICRGTIVMSNVFLSSSLIYLASVEAGCVEFINGIDEEGTLINDCTRKTHGFKPTSLITNISVVTGLLAAFLAPVLGAVIDYTPYRRQMGILTAALATIIQAIQIGTTQKTWFPMAILQSIVGFIFFIQVMATYAYLPEMARNVGGDVMNHFTKWFVFIQFSSQIFFMMTIIGSGIILQLNTVETGQAGQALSSLASIIGFTYAWGKLIPDRPASRVLPKGQSLLLQGFRQNYRTIQTITKHYRKGLYWFMISTTLGEAGVSALLPVGVTFLTEEVKLGGLEIGIVFAMALITSLFGSFLGAAITSRTNPRISWICCMTYFVAVTLAGAFALVEERAYLGYVWGGLWGLGLGWFYPVENLMFSLCLPRGSENEMTGLFIYTNQVLAWLPPFAFSIIIESGLNSRWGYMSLLIFQSLTILTLLCGMAPWSEVLEETEKIIKDEDETNNEDTDN